MMFFTIILVIFIALILISIANTLLFIALKLVTKERYKEHYLIIPSFISLVLWLIAYIASMKLISLITGISVFDSISGSLFNTSNFSKFIPSLLIPMAVLIALTLFLQSIVLLTVNVDYSIPFNRFRYFAKKKIKKLIKHDESATIICEKTEVKEVKEKYKLDFINSFVCSLFIFSLLFFLGILFFWIGTLIAAKLI